MGPALRCSNMGCLWELWHCVDLYHSSGSQSFAQLWVRAHIFASIAPIHTQMLQISTAPALLCRQVRRILYWATFTAPGDLQGRLVCNAAAVQTMILMPSLHIQPWKAPCPPQELADPADTANSCSTADVVSLGDAWLGPAIRRGLIQPIPNATSYR